MYLVSVPSVASIARSGVPEAASHVPGQGVCCHIAQIRGAKGPDELQAHVGRYALGVLDGPGPGKVSLHGAAVALHAVQPGVYAVHLSI